MNGDNPTPRERLEQQIEWGERLLEEARQAAGTTMDQIAQIVAFVGSNEDARRLAPTRFEEAEARDQRVRDIQTILDRRRAELDELP